MDISKITFESREKLVEMAQSAVDNYHRRVEDGEIFHFAQSWGHSMIETLRDNPMLENNIEYILYDAVLIGYWYARKETEINGSL